MSNYFACNAAFAFDSHLRYITLPRFHANTAAALVFSLQRVPCMTLSWSMCLSTNTSDRDIDTANSSQRPTLDKKHVPGCFPPIVVCFSLHRNFINRYRMLQGEFTLSLRRSVCWHNASGALSYTSPGACMVY